jgi:hypothetical protein
LGSDAHSKRQLRAMDPRVKPEDDKDKNDAPIKT